jgi:hypothetical protein
MWAGTASPMGGHHITEKISSTLSAQLRGKVKAKDRVVQKALIADMPRQSRNVA